MEDLPFDNEEFDIIWSEEAIYNMGFKAGIRKWKDYLKTGGYSPVGYFVLTQNSWIDNYYKPIEKRFSAFLEKHNNSEMAVHKIYAFRCNWYYLKSL